VSVAVVSAVSVALFNSPGAWASGLPGKDDRQVEAAGQRGAAAAGVGMTAAAAAPLGQPNVLVAHSALDWNQIRGEFGEAIVGRLPPRWLLETGQWRPITPRLGPQGIDHLFVKLDAAGLPRSLMIVEAKYGKARLAWTRDGLQLGRSWCAARLATTSKHYKALLRLNRMDRISTGHAVATLNPKRTMSIPLNARTDAVFGKIGTGPAWSFAGDARQLQMARRTLERLTHVLDAAATGRIEYRRRLIRVDWEGEHLCFHIKNAEMLDSLGSEALLPERPPVRFTESEMRTARHEFERIATRRLSDAGFGADDARMLAGQLGRDEMLGEVLQAKKNGWRSSLLKSSVRSLLASSGRTATVGAIVGMSLDALSQGLGSGFVDTTQLLRTGALSGLATAAGTVAGHGTMLLLARNRQVTNVLASPLRGLGPRAPGLARTAGGAAAAGLVASLVFAYGGAALGWHSVDEANRMFVAGLAGAGASTLASSGMLALGGGLVVVTATGTIVGVLVPVAVGTAFRLYDEAKDMERLSRWVAYLLKRPPPPPPKIIREFEAMREAGRGIIREMLKPRSPIYTY
jgi:hypothetical protein